MAHNTTKGGGDQDGLPGTEALCGARELVARDGLCVSRAGFGYTGDEGMDQTDRTVRTDRSDASPFAYAGER
jgi:hypothetical protein